MNHLVKICGLANEQDVQETLSLRPDAVGFIFWPKSPRGVTAEEVAAWTRGAIPDGIRKVGVFVDTPVAEIPVLAETAGLDVVQLHGAYSAEEISTLQVPVWRVLHADRLPEDWNEVPVEALLIDSGTVQMPGGTGVRVDTGRAGELTRQSRIPVVLAGGLNAGNVANAISEIQPDGVDVSSGVEAEPGKKDLKAVASFISESRTAFRSLSSPKS